jgi:DNA-binding CsgD family transcriptional regulator
MTKADTLRMRDVRAVCRLIGECRELGGDHALWQSHLLSGLRELLDVAQAGGGEAHWPRRDAAVSKVSAFDVTDDPAMHAAFVCFHREGGPAADPSYRAMAHARLRVRGPIITRTRRQLVPDADWFRSDTYERFRRPAGIAHEMTSIFTCSQDGRTNVIGLGRNAAQRDFSDREQRVLLFLHEEIGRLVGGPLASAAEAAPDTLTPRLQQTLSSLLDGDSERQVATRLGLSQTTVHQYVMTLYRHFGVRSRAQLLAHALRRRHHERWKRFLGGR